MLNVYRVGGEDAADELAAKTTKALIHPADVGKTEVTQSIMAKKGERERKREQLQWKTGTNEGKTGSNATD